MTGKLPTKYSVVEWNESLKEKFIKTIWPYLDIRFYFEPQDIVVD